MSPAAGAVRIASSSVFAAGIKRGEREKKGRLKQAATVSFKKKKTGIASKTCGAKRVGSHGKTTNRPSLRYKYRYEERGTLIF